MRERYNAEIEQHRRIVDANAILSKELSKCFTQHLADFTAWTERHANIAKTIDDLSSKLRETEYRLMPNLGCSTRIGTKSQRKQEPCMTPPLTWKKSTRQPGNSRNKFVSLRRKT